MFTFFPLNNFSLVYASGTARKRVLDFNIPPYNLVRILELQLKKTFIYIFMSLKNESF